MAKSAPTPVAPEFDDRWSAEDALSVLRRAGEIVGDKKLMGAVKKLATERATEMIGIAAKASQLAKMGRISPKAMAKLSK